MIIHSKKSNSRHERFPCYLYYIYIIRSNENWDKYSVVFQSRFNANVNVSITDLEYSTAVEILSDITEGIINNKFYLKIEN